ncbi:Transcriptional regulator, contains XRE-family HTH domain [Lachnospiraceae bacterium XPB1003]|nr:Transcriptional regulator, contains XRE-family HTH domain [Lachnospiraceae bacterium XPB1003]
MLRFSEININVIVFRMSRVDRKIAENLKRIRKAGNMSLDTMAARTGVSKSMLGQIERGESNPTVATIEKIAEGLKISFDELFYTREEDIRVVDPERMEIYREKEGKYRIRQIFGYDSRRTFEVYQAEIYPSGSMRDITDKEDAVRYITVLEGELLLHADHEVYTLSPGDEVRIAGGKAYQIENRSGMFARISLLLSFERGTRR